PPSSLFPVSVVLSDRLPFLLLHILRPLILFPENLIRPLLCRACVDLCSVSRKAKELAVVMGDSSSSYIRMVHHLIEECILFKMSKEECMEALSKHANIEPVITSTVWKELEKENKEFFEAYARSMREEERGSRAETRQRIQKMLSDASKLHDTQHR
ncbi:hypothetical protein EUGRSUZ_K03172, partial [Eucalyptus grandis]